MVVEEAVVVMRGGSVSSVDADGGCGGVVVALEQSDGGVVCGSACW